MEATSPMAEMPKYECHKVVHALKIESIKFDHELANEENRETDGSAILSFSDERYSPMKVDHDFVMRIKPGDGRGYYVVYKDGYKSWSPTKAFEDGYTRV